MSKRFHPILYSTPMVQAILEKRKTKTRRTKGLEIVNDNPGRYVWLKDYPQIDIPRQAIPYDDKFYYAFTGKHNNSFLNVVTCPYGKIGDVLWVKETHYLFGEWKVDGLTKKTKKLKYHFVSHDDDVMFEDKMLSLGETFQLDIKPNSYRLPAWYKRLGRFMFKKHCRIFLQITDIKIERLQEISEEDVIKEGIVCTYGWEENHKGSLGSLMPSSKFKQLWQKINGPKSWEANPFVWVISFKQIDKPENFN